MYNLLKLQNEHWEKANISQSGIKRTLMGPLFQEKDKNNITVLKGARQTGKSFLFKMIISKLIKNGVNPHHIYYINFDDTSLRDKTNENLDVFKNFILNEIKQHQGSKLYFFIDEFQKVKNITDLIKILFESTNHVKFYLSGSSSLVISEKISESLLGRTSEYILNTLSFKELIDCKYQLPTINLEQLLNDPQRIIKKFNLYKEDIIHEFKQFMLYGGYPKLTETNNRLEKIKILKDNIDNYINKDILGELKIERINEYKKLMQYLSSTTGSLLNMNNMGNDLGLSFVTTKKYLNILSNTYITNLLSPYSSNVINTIKKANKNYFLDSGLRNVLAEEYEQESLSMGQVLENLLWLKLYQYNNYSKLFLGNIFYLRTSNNSEIDFVYKYQKKLYLFESKIKFGINKSYINLAHKLNVDKVYIITLNSQNKSVIKNGIKIIEIPIYLLWLAE